MQKPRNVLGDLEQLVMDFIWKHGPVTTEQVRDGLVRRHPMKESTARTIVRRLEQKGYLSHTVQGRTHIYSGTDRPQNVAARVVRQIIDRFCGGSLEELLIGMVNDDVVDSKELEAIARRVAMRRKEE
jgi:BlaI family penicillinase repressor